jgi:hypothetical protein
MLNGKTVNLLISDTKYCSPTLIYNLNSCSSKILELQIFSSSGERSVLGSVKNVTDLVYL